MSTTTRTFSTIEEVKAANAEHGHFFFEPASMRFFDSRILSAVYPRQGGGAYFVTSERFDWNSPRLYTLRECLPSGAINTVSEFQEFATADQAKRATSKAGR